MDFKDLLTPIKELSDPKEIAVLAIVYFVFAKLFKAIKKLIGWQNKATKELESYRQLQIDIQELKKEVTEYKQRKHQLDADFQNSQTLLREAIATLKKYNNEK